MGLPELSYLASMTGPADRRVAEVSRFAPSGPGQQAELDPALSPSSKATHITCPLM